MRNLYLVPWRKPKDPPHDGTRDQTNGVSRSVAGADRVVKEFRKPSGDRDWSAYRCHGYTVDQC